MHRSIRWPGLAALALVVGVGCGGDPLVMTITAEPQASAEANGTSPITLKIHVSKGTKLKDGTINLRGDLAGCAFNEPISMDTVPDPNGCQGTAELVGGDAAARIYSNQKGAVNVTATYQDPVAMTSVQEKIALTFTRGVGGDDIAAFEYVGVEPEQITIRGSGTVTFIARDSLAQPVGNAEVVFTLSQNPGGASHTPDHAFTGPDGRVSTTLTAGDVPGPVVVKIANLSGSVFKESDAIAISGGGINAKNLTLACPHYSIGGFEEFGLMMTCTVYGADINGAYVPASKVIFMTEAGGVPATADFSDTGNGGQALCRYTTQCKWPKDVAPLGADDPGHPCRFNNHCGPTGPVIEDRTCNPRDGVAVLVAITSGSEGFTDLNGNGVWDPGEPWEDLPEPFVDANDNETRDPDEEYRDSNNNQIWDGPNGKYDSNTFIWKAVKITWTGEPDISIPMSKIEPAGHQTNEHCATLRYTVTVKDINGNAPTAFYSGDALNASPSGNCSIAHAGLYFDGPGGGVAQIDVVDGHGCDYPCPDCTQADYAIDFTLHRTLDQAGFYVEDILQSFHVTGTWK